MVKTNTKNKQKSSANAVVVFCNSDSLWFLKFLRKNYRHCFIALKSDMDWIVYEPLLSRTEITTIRNTTIEDVRECFHMMGCTTVATHLQRDKPLSRRLFSFFSCVTAVKRVLGIQDSALFTPYQLYKYLQKDI